MATMFSTFSGGEENKYTFKSWEYQCERCIQSTPYIKSKSHACIIPDFFFFLIPPYCILPFKVAEYVFNYQRELGNQIRCCIMLQLCISGNVNSSFIAVWVCLTFGIVDMSQKQLLWIILSLAYFSSFSFKICNTTELSVMLTSLHKK